MRRFIEKVTDRAADICLYGIAPPKRATPPKRLTKIVDKHLTRIRDLDPDGVILYDIQDEAERAADERPFPFLPTLDPHTYAYEHLKALHMPKIVYRSVGRDDAADFSSWIGRPRAGVVLVGAASKSAAVTLSLSQAYALAREHAPDQLVGGIAIAERHARKGSEHERMVAKMRKGCSFFVTQAVYDVTASKSLISDYALALSAIDREAVPLILTFAPCASEKTLAFMQWLGISFPRWLENELKHARDPLATSLRLCEDTFEELRRFAHTKGVPLGINVESVSIRKAEIDASVELFQSLRRRMPRSTADNA